MKTKHEIQQLVGAWVADEDLPVRANLKVIRPHDPNLGLSEDEIAERDEFIAWYLRRDFEPLLALPESQPDDGFYLADLGVADEGYGAFHTRDFHKRLRPFDRFGHAMKKVLERVHDLAIRHSVVSFEDSRQRVERRFQALLEREFTWEMESLAMALHEAEDAAEKADIHARINRLARHGQECLLTWARHSAPSPS